MKAASLLAIITAWWSASSPVQGIASWYGEDHRGKTMANGQPFDPDAMTCATYYWPLGTVLIVEYHGLKVRVTVTDRGPNKRLRRLIDLSRAAFTKLAPTDDGLIEVSVTVEGPR